MTREEIEIFEKKELIRELFSEVYIPALQYFDLDSNELLEEKISVLTALKEGKEIKDIPGFYKVLELLPDEGQIWD